MRSRTAQFACAARALWMVNRDGKSAIPVLLEVLKKGSGPRYREAAAGYLAAIGRGTAEVRLALHQALKDPSLRVREATARALRRFEGE